MITKNIGASFVLKVNLKYGWKYILLLIIYGTAIYLLSRFNILNLPDISGFGIGSFGTVLAIMVGFRNNFSYDRWWEGRKIWGLLVNYSRALASQSIGFFNDWDKQGIDKSTITEEAQSIIKRHLAFVHSLRIHLRGDKDIETLKKYLSPEEFDEVTNKVNVPDYILLNQRIHLKEVREARLINDFHYVELDRTITEFNNIQGKSERIKKTPLPRQYDYFTKMFIYIFAIILPFGLISSLGAFMIPMYVIILYFFIVIDLIGEVNEDPFEDFLTALPLSSLCNTIERSLLEQIGESNIPEPLIHRKGILM